MAGGWLRPIVFGAVDGLVTNGSLSAGVGGGGVGHRTLLLTGLAGLVPRPLTCSSRVLWVFRTMVRDAAVLTAEREEGTAAMKRR